MSASAKSLAPEATRAIASADPLVTWIATASPSAPNRPRADAITKGAAPASIGRSSENWIAIGCRTSSAAQLAPGPKPKTQKTKTQKTKTHKTKTQKTMTQQSPITEATKQRTAMVWLARMGTTSGPGSVAAPCMLV